MSTIKVDTIQNTSGVEVYTAKAWINLNAVTPAIINSGNVGSVTDNGTGDFTINFSSALSAATYTASCITTQPIGSGVYAKIVGADFTSGPTTQTTSALRVGTNVYDNNGCGWTVTL